MTTTTLTSRSVLLSLTERLLARKLRQCEKHPTEDRFVQLPTPLLDRLLTEAELFRDGCGADELAEQPILPTVLGCLMGVCAALEGQALTDGTTASRQLADRCVNLALDVAKRLREVEQASS